MRGTQRYLTYVTRPGLLMLRLDDCLLQLPLNLKLSVSHSSRAAQPLRAPTTHTGSQAESSTSDESSCKQAEPQKAGVTKQTADCEWWELCAVMGN